MEKTGPRTSATAKLVDTWTFLISDGAPCQELCGMGASYAKNVVGSIAGPCKTVLKGWPFSRNTKGDTWKDARLVTGANAWAIYGLGVFVAERTQDVPSEQARNALKSCYLDGIEGLLEHRRALGDGMSLVTAGWTTTGLVHARSPQSLDPTLPAYPKDSEERWAYYDVLDAIGYDAFPSEEDQWPQIRTYRLVPGAEPNAKVYGRTITVRPSDWAALRRRVAAQNVVTEHNLDVLAVLNYALTVQDKVGPNDTDARAKWAFQLKEWRDSLQKGIFELLWDDQTWSDDLHESQSALKDAPLGRIVTGGTLDQTTSADFPLFAPSSHSAIDNCSWLALSVDPDHLGTTYRTRLAQCLQYTLLVFAKDLPFAGKNYYGTHYFKNNFKDPYIEESPLQEKSYHLEATGGLVLGLIRFADAWPDHPRAEHFRREALRLWAGMQDFVTDWGFLYSSQRIHNLSTRLASSTAMIWFIDVDQELNPEGAHLQSTFEPGYAELDVPFEDVQAAILTLGDLMQAPETSTVPRDLVHQFGLTLVLRRGKLLSKFGQRIVTLMDDALQIPPGLLATSLVGINTAVYLGATGEVDVGLETILVGPEPPTSAIWNREGVIPSGAAVVQPAGSHFRPEREIRREVSMYAEGPVLDNPLANPSFAFDDDRIYFIDMNWFELESPLGQLGVLRPASDAFWPVFALKADRPRAEILNDFIRNHRLWKGLAPLAQNWSEPLRIAWLYLVELAIRGDFDRAAAERYGLRAIANSEDSTPNTTPPPDAHPTPSADGPSTPDTTPKSNNQGPKNPTPGELVYSGPDAAQAALRHGASWSDPLLQDLKWAPWLLDPSIEVPSMPEADKALQDFAHTLVSDHGQSLPELVPGKLEGSSNNLVLPAMPHHPTNQAAFQLYVRSLFASEFPQEEGWKAPVETVIDEWIAPNGIAIIRDYQIKVWHQDGHTSTARWEENAHHPNRILEWNQTLVKLVDDRAKPDLTPAGKPVWTTDAIVVQHFDAITHYFEQHQNETIQRIRETKTLTDERHYPKGVAEIPVGTIWRSAPIQIGGSDGRKTLFELVESLLNRGKDVDNPISIHVPADDRLVLEGRGHQVIAVFAGLGQTHVPVEFVDASGSRVQEGETSAPTWRDGQRSAPTNGPQTDKFKHTDAIPAPQNVSFGSNNWRNQPILHASYEASPFFDSLGFVASHNKKMIEGLSTGQRPERAVNANIVFFVKIPKNLIDPIKEEGLPIHALNNHEGQEPIPGRPLYFTAFQRWLNDDGELIDGRRSKVFEYTPVQKSTIHVSGELDVEKVDGAFRFKLTSSFVFNGKFFQKQYGVTPTRVSVYIYLADLKTKTPETFFVREYTTFDATARWNDDEWDQDTIEALLFGLTESNGIFITVRVHDDDTDDTIQGEDYRININPNFFSLKRE